MASGSDTPILSWYDYSTRIPSNYQFRGRYINTKDPLPNMNYKQLESALPSSYDLPLVEEPMEEGESPPELIFEEQAPPVEKAPHIELILPAKKAPPVKQAPPAKKKSEDHISLTPATGSVGDEITVEAPQGLLEIHEVQVDDVTAKFVAVSNTSLVFEIPLGATSGTVRLFSSEGEVINIGIIKIVDR